MIAFGSTKLQGVYQAVGSAQWKEMEGQAVILDPRNSQVVRLNELGARIWKQINGINTLEEIAASLEKEYNVPRRKAEKDTLDFVCKLFERELIVKKHD